MVTWQGFIAEQQLTLDGVTYIRSMIDQANAVKVLYTRIGDTLITNGGAIRADGAVSVSASNATTELAVAATAGAGEFGGVAMGAVVSVLEGLTEASISGTSSVDSRTQDADHTGAASLTVSAKETVDISHNAGAAGVGKIGGVGTAVNVVIGKSRVIAGAAGSSLEVEGALDVSALREADKC